MGMKKDDMAEMLVRIDEATKKTSEDVKMLRHVLCEGNGTPAVTTSVATLTEKVRQLEEAVAPWYQRYGLYVGGGGGLVVAVEHLLKALGH